jgi:PBP1b-binding outer membrane lipoprotein LpoB
LYRDSGFIMKLVDLRKGEIKWSSYKEVHPAV